MRVLLTCRPGYGHYFPLVPLARAAAGAGHAVAVASGEPVRGLAQADGFETFPAGPSFAVARQSIAARFGDLGAIPPEQHRAFFFGQVFTGIELPARLPELLAIADKWQPDLIVHELSEFAGPLTAQLTGTPYVTFGYGPMLEPEIAGVAAAAAGPHWAAAGLDPCGARLYRSAYLDPCPPGLQVAAIASVAHRIPIRPEPAMAGSAAPDWLGSLPGRPVVYVTLGTVWNQDQSIFRTILGGLAGRAGRVIVALGPGQDPAALGPQPPTVRVCDVVPHAVLMDRCDLVVCHGGAGTVLDALAAGVPLLLLPQAADQFYNADRVVAARAGVCLRRGELTPEAIASAAGLLLDEPGYRRAAAAIAAEVGAMPPATAVVPVLARLSRPRPPAARRAPGAT